MKRYIYFLIQISCNYFKNELIYTIEKNEIIFETERKKNQNETIKINKETYEVLINDVIISKDYLQESNIYYHEEFFDLFKYSRRFLRIKLNGEEKLLIVIKKGNWEDFENHIYELKLEYQGINDFYSMEIYSNDLEIDIQRLLLKYLNYYVLQIFAYLLGKRQTEEIFQSRQKFNYSIYFKRKTGINFFPSSVLVKRKIGTKLIPSRFLVTANKIKFRMTQHAMPIMIEDYFENFSILNNLIFNEELVDNQIIYLETLIYIKRIIDNNSELYHKFRRKLEKSPVFFCSSSLTGNLLSYLDFLSFHFKEKIFDIFGLDVSNITESIFKVEINQNRSDMKF